MSKFLNSLALTCPFVEVYYELNIRLMIVCDSPVEYIHYTDRTINNFAKAVIRNYTCLRVDRPVHSARTHTHTHTHTHHTHPHIHTPARAHTHTHTRAHAHAGCTATNVAMDKYFIHVHASHLLYSPQTRAPTSGILFMFMAFPICICTQNTQ